MVETKNEKSWFEKDRVYFFTLCKDLMMQCFFILFLSIMFGPTTLVAKETLLISGAIGLEPHYQSANVLREAYGRIGISLKFKYAPTARSIWLANEGFVDGEIHRAEGMGKKYQNLVMVPAPVNFSGVNAITKGLKFTVDGWESLRPYRIGIRRGSKRSEKKTEGMNVVALSKPIQLIQMLNSGRIDVAVASISEFELKKILKRLQEKGESIQNIQILTPPVLRLPVFHYLHKKNSHLVPRLTKILQEMEKEGLSRKLLQKFYQDQE